MSRKYSEEIYPETATQSIHGPMYLVSYRKDFERAYDRGFEDGKQTQGGLTGWSNLTEAIKAGERIDWERLDGVEAMCVHPELGTLTHKLERDPQGPVDNYLGWYADYCHAAWYEAFSCAWKGTHNWTLYIKGPVPLRARTADSLEPGTVFRGRVPCEGGHVELSGVGTFQKQKGQA